MFPVLKNADCRRVRKKSEIRASDRVSDRKGDDANDAGTSSVPFAWALDDVDFKNV